METERTWYAAKAGNAHQGLVIDEKTGRNVAVSYDVADTAILAAAPGMLDALELAQATVERLQRHAPGSANGTLDVVRAAIAKAKGE